MFFSDVSAHPCPRCKTLIVKENDGSCNHMHCTLCGAEFCWLCLKGTVQYLGSYSSPTVTLQKSMIYIICRRRDARFGEKNSGVIRSGFCGKLVGLKKKILGKKWKITENFLI